MPFAQEKHGLRGRQRWRTLLHLDKWFEEDAVLGGSEGWPVVADEDAQEVGSGQEVRGQFQLQTERAEGRRRIQVRSGALPQS